MTTETFNYSGINRPSIPMDSNAVLDYVFNWSDWLFAISDDITSHTVTVNGVTLDSSLVIDGLEEGGANVTNSRVRVWLSSPTVAVASCACRITTTGGRTDERTFYPLGQER